MSVFVARINKRWDNIIGIVYDEFWEECYVTFVNSKTGKMETALLSNMEDAD